VTDVRRLVARLDVAQKVAQIQGIVPMDLVDVAALLDGSRPAPDLTKGFPHDLERLPQVRPHGVGHLSLGWQLAEDLAGLRTEIARFQDIACEVNPFGIATLVHAEGVSGLVHPQGHQFTTPWGQAATWDPEVPRTVGQVAAAQARWVGIHLFFSPLFDLARDLRWGRVHETYGEDPELVTRMGIGFVRGVQGDDGASGMLATGKHFLAYGHSLGALNQAVTQLGPRELTDVHAEPFRRAIAEAGLSVVMNSYNEVDGVPAATNRWLLTDLLRDQLGFDGLVVSDYGSIVMLHQTYRTAGSPANAAAQALSAGLDVELPSDATTNGLAALVEDGTLPEEVLDRAVANVLRLKVRLGLVPEVRFGSPPVAPEPVDPDAADDAARRIARTAVTLLANDGILPLTPGGRRIVVVGPAADEIRIHFGAYSSVADAELPVAIARIVTGQVEGAEASPDVFPDLFQTRLPGIEPVFEEGARRLHPDSVTVLQAIQSLDGDVTHRPYGSFDDDGLDIDGLTAAVADADVVIAVVGERTGWVGNHTAGEGRTTANPTLPGNQNALLAALHATGTPVVTVVVAGRPLLLQEAHDSSAAVLLAPLLGPVAGPAVADVLFGHAEPGGRTPSTFPRHLGQVPLHHGAPAGSGYDHPELPRLGYVDLPDSTPLYPFGHGLTFTDFELDLIVAAVQDGAVDVYAKLQNTGRRAGTAVVQLYARDEGASVVRPVRQLVDFVRVEVEAGQAADLRLQGPLERLAYTWPDGRRGVEAGPVTMLLGLSSADIRCWSTVEVPERVTEDRT